MIPMVFPLIKGKHTCFISFIHMIKIGDQCTGDTMKQMILSNGRNYLSRWLRIRLTMKRDAFQDLVLRQRSGHLLVYTGVMEKETGKEKVSYQNQCLAFGDGKTYTKLEQNPVITGDMLPEHFSREHFRDPKIWKEEDGYYMVVGNKTDKGVPQVVLFRSEDAIRWSYVSVLASDRDGELGTMWECPDFFCLENAYVLITSPQDLRATEEFHNGNNSVYYLGTYDKKQHVFDYKSVYSLDDGLDFYAPQTMLTPDGRRIMVGWMQSWDSNIRPAEQKWSCMMTLPRELRMEQGKLVQSPVREIEKYYRNAVSYQNMEISGQCQMQGIKGRVLDMTVEIVCGEYRQFTISFAQNERYHTDFMIQKDSNMIEFNRTYSGMVRDAIAIRKTKIKTSTDRLQIRLVLDKYSAEVFLNDGQQVFSSTSIRQWRLMKLVLCVMERQLLIFRSTIL